MTKRALRRSTLLALTLLASCAAAGADRPPRAAAQPPGAPAIGDSAPIAASDFLIGRLAGQQGDLDLAATSFLQALSLDPGVQELREQAFLACLLTGRPEAERLAQSLPNDPIAQLLLANRAAKRGQWDAAQTRLANLPREGTTQVVQPLLLAWTQLGAGHADQALATLRARSEGDKPRGIYVLHTALIADLAQRDPEAARLYRLAEAAFGESNLSLARQLASWQARQGDTAQANRTLADMIARSPDLAIALPALQRDVAERQVRRVTDGMADAYLALASALRQQDVTDSAVLILRLALDLRPDLTAARLLTAELEAEAKHPEAALATLAPVPAADPLAALVDLRRAGLLDKLGRDEEALALLTTMQAAYPDRPEPWSMQGSILRGQHQYPEAVAAYDQAVRRLANPTRADWPLFYERGIALERSHRWPDAQADFEQALRLAPDEPFVLNYLAYSWTEQGQNLAQARQMVERAARQRPNDGAIVDSLGWVRLRQGDVAGAVQDLEHAVELEPEDATINGHLGDAYQAAGREREALFQWRRALTLKPDPDDRARVQAKLREVGATEDGAAAPTGGGAATTAKATP